MIKGTTNKNIFIVKNLYSRKESQKELGAQIISIAHDPLDSAHKSPIIRVNDKNKGLASNR